jgi:uncharacterized protein YegL
MHEYRCGDCGWGARAPYLQGVLAASEQHAKDGCQPTTEGNTMTDSDLTRLVILADRSGSMGHIQKDMNGGIRQLLADQAKEPGTVVVDIVTFDTVVENPYTGVRPDDVKSDIIVARGGTALNDALGMTIVRLGEELAALPEDDRPGHVIFVVVTDGEENSSREYTAPQVKALVEEQQEKWGWTFLFLGANIDAFAVAGGYGIIRDHSINYAATAKGASSVIATASAGITRTRSGLATDFTDEEREAAGA